MRGRYHRLDAVQCFLCVDTGFILCDVLSGHVDLWHARRHFRGSDANRIVINIAEFLGESVSLCEGHHISLVARRLCHRPSCMISAGT